MKKSAALAVLALTLGACSSVQNPVPHDPSFAKMASLAKAREERPEYPAEAAAYFALFRETPNGESPTELAYRAHRDIRERRATRVTAGVPSILPNLKIESFGPGNFGGRLRGIVAHPSTPDTMLVGSVSGGVWKTTDGGGAWVPINDFLANLAVGSMLQDPDDEDTVWLGTGEGFFNVDAMQGMGIFTSDDFGDSFTPLASTQNSDFLYVNRIGRVPGTNIVLAATRTGIWRSNNLGASWTETSGITTSGRGFTDLKIDPTNGNRMWAFHYGGGIATRRIYRSNNSGNSWTELNDTHGLPVTNIGRMEIGVGADGVVYASVANSGDSTRGLWRAPSPGNAFTQTASTTPYIERQGWYDLPIGVDPSDSDRVFVGAVDLFRTTNAGATITKQTFWNPSAGQIPEYVHADLHVVTFHPTDPDIVFIGSDGGIFKSTDGGDTFVSLNSDLRVAQYYGMAVHPNGEQVIGGTQDNGSHLFFGDKATWLQWFGGDGGYCSWDQQQPAFIYGATPRAGLFGSGDGGASATGLNLPSTAGALFISPFTIDENDGNRMLVGIGSVLYTENLRLLGGATFTDVGPVGVGSVSATTISRHDGATAFVGKTNGTIWRTTGLGSGGAWAQVDDPTMPNTAVTWIEVDANDGTGDTVYATFSGFGGDRIWKSTDGGATWSSIHGDLPDIPLFSVVADPTDPSRLFLGSELGLWSTDDNGGTLGALSWDQYDYGIAFSRIMQLHWGSDDVLWAATHGRSIYRIERDPVEVGLGDITTAGCGTADDGILDHGETADVPVTVANGGGFELQNVQVAVSTAYTDLDVLTGPQAYGTIAAGGEATMSFAIAMTGFQGCLDVATLDIDVTYDGGASAQTADLQLSADPVIGTGTFADGAEGATSLMTSEAAVGVDDWGPVDTQANSGSSSWFASDVPSFADKSLLSPWFEVGAGTTTLAFSLYYDLEGDATQRWDGVVLEARQPGGTWEDIGVLSTVPYDGQLFINNTIPARDAWSGVQTSWRDATVDLGGDWNGQTRQFRFRLVCDTNTANTGFWVDDIAITNVSWLEELVCDGGCGPIFADGFEDGSTSAWSQTVP